MCETIPCLTKGVTSEGVENKIDASSIRGTLDGFCKGSITAVEDVIFWNFVLAHKELFFCHASNCSKYLGSNHLAKDDGSLANTTRCSMDKDTLIFLKATEIK